MSGLDVAAPQTSRDALRLTFITTLRHNVGDDFVREGLHHLLEARFGPLAVESVHKHAPVSVRPGFEWVRRRELSAVLDAVPLGWTRDRLLESDLVVQSGAPVYWSLPGRVRCSDNEWYAPLIQRRWSRVRERVPLLNLAAGACQPYHSRGDELLADARVVAYARALFERSSLTTVRDRLSERFLHALGLSAERIPCASLFARDRLGIAPRTPDCVALNVMPLGGHYDLAQGIDGRRWLREFARFYARARRRARCVFVCHDRRELRLARAIDADAEVFWSRSHADYLRFYAHAAAGVLNRVHGAFALASFGRPAFVVGSDTRSHMVEELGLRHAFVGDVDAVRLLRELDAQLDAAAAHAHALEGVRARARAAYARVLAPVGPEARA